MAALLAHRRPAGGRAHGVQGGAAAAADAPAGVEEPQREVGVLAVRAGEAFVEASGPAEDLGAVGHVGADPAGAGQSRGAAFPVGGAASAGQRHGDDARNARGVGRRLVEVLVELGAPVRPDLDVVVDEHHPGFGDGAQSCVAGGGGAARLSRQHGGAGTQVAEDVQRVLQGFRVGDGRGGTVVDEDDALRARSARGGQRGEAVGEALADQGGDHYGVRRHRGAHLPHPAYGPPGRGPAGVGRRSGNGAWSPGSCMGGVGSVPGSGEYCGERVPHPTCVKPLDMACPAPCGYAVLRTSVHRDGGPRRSEGGRSQGVVRRSGDNSHRARSPVRRHAPADCKPGVQPVCAVRACRFRPGGRRQRGPCSAPLRPGPRWPRRRRPGARAWSRPRPAPSGEGGAGGGASLRAGAAGCS
ncbi:hypothetical protein STREPTOSP366_54130 [Streptomyces variabilis]